MGNATFYWDGLKCLIMITVSHFHLTIDWQNNTKLVLIYSLAIFRALGVGSILHSGEVLLLGFIWGHEFLHLTLGVVTLIPRCTSFSILPLKACKH